MGADCCCCRVTGVGGGEGAAHARGWRLLRGGNGGGRVCPLSETRGESPGGGDSVGCRVPRGRVGGPPAPYSLAACYCCRWRSAPTGFALPVARRLSRQSPPLPEDTAAPPRPVRPRPAPTRRAPPRRLCVASAARSRCRLPGGTRRARVPSTHPRVCVDGSTGRATLPSVLGQPLPPPFPSTPRSVVSVCGAATAPLPRLCPP